MSIFKDKRFKNKYELMIDSTNEDFQEIIKSYSKFRCIICNRETAKAFRPGLLAFGYLPITIRNDIPTGIFWINGMY